MAEKTKSNFNWKDINYGQVAQGIQQGLQSGMQINQTKNRIRSIQEQVKMNRENFENVMAQRNEEAAQSMAMIQSTEARRGITGASTGIIKEMDESAGRQERVIENEMLLTERNLMFAQQMEQAVAKQQKRNQTLGMITGALNMGIGMASGFGGA